MRAYIKAYIPDSESALSKQPLRNRHSDKKRYFAYFIEYGSMNFGPFFSERSADNFLSKQGFVIETDDNGLYYEHKYKSEVQQKIEAHYRKS